MPFKFVLTSVLVCAESVADGTFWGTVASDVVASGDVMMRLQVDMDSITSLFTKVVDPRANAKTPKPSPAPGPAKVALLPQQRATNMGITFAKLKVSPRAPSLL